MEEFKVGDKVRRNKVGTGAVLEGTKGEVTHLECQCSNPDCPRIEVKFEGFASMGIYEDRIEKIDG